MHHWIHRILTLLKGTNRAQDEQEQPTELPPGAAVQLPITPLDIGRPQQLTLYDIDQTTTAAQTVVDSSEAPVADSPPTKPAKESGKRAKEPSKRSKKPDKDRRSPKKAEPAKVGTVAKRVIKPKGTPLEVATAYIEQNNYAAAVKLLDDIIAADPKCVDALYKRAKLMDSLGKTFEAIGDYTALIKAGYVSAEVYSARSKLFFKLGDEAQAMRDRQNAKDIYLRTMSELQL